MTVPGRAACWLAGASIVLAGACGGGDRPGDEARPGGETTPTTVEPTTVPEATTTAPPTTTPFDPHALRPPAPAGDPAGLAAQITEAETTIRRVRVTARDLDAAALAQQVAYRQLGDRPQWDAAVQTALPPELREVTQRHVAARRDLRALTGEPSDVMPAWRIVAPPPAADLQAWYQEAEGEFGVPWTYLAAINLVESGMGRIRGASTAGAQGPMQFLPSTWAAYGEGDINDPYQAVRAAARLLTASGGPEDMRAALYAYNHSDRYVRAVTAYAGLIGEHPNAYAAFHAWGVYFWTTAGDIHLPVGWEAAEPVPVDDYVATHPA